MKRVALTQRVEQVPGYGERRDALDQRWSGFLAEAGLLAVPLPNNLRVLPGLLRELGIEGIVLTGGGDLVAYGGDSPERDDVEEFLLRHAAGNDIPLVGICRGMQAIQHFFGVKLQAVTGHVTREHAVLVDGRPQQVNSFHRLGTRETAPALEVRAIAQDGVIEAVRHRELRIHGIMWHPERLQPFRPEDIAFFRDAFGVQDR